MIDPVAFTLFGHDFRWYGVMVAAGFLCACANWNALDRRAGFPAGFGNEFGFVVMTSGLIGARLAHVFGEWHHYAAHPADILRVTSGGMTFYGGFILAFLCGVLLARFRRLSPLQVADYGVAGLALGHGIGRIGCLLNGCCYGRETTSALGMITAGVQRLPVPLFETVFNVLLCAFLNWFYLTRRRFTGQVLALYLLLYGAWRLAIEFLRADSRVFVAGLSSAQWTSMVLIWTGVLLWLKGSAHKRTAAGHD